MLVVVARELRFPVAGDMSVETLQCILHVGMLLLVDEDDDKMLKLTLS